MSKDSIRATENFLMNLLPDISIKRIGKKHRKLRGFAQEFCNNQTRENSWLPKDLLEMEFCQKGKIDNKLP